MKLSIILPTVGRNTLGRTIESLVRQPLDPDDEVLVIGGPASTVEPMLPSSMTYLPSLPGRNWGCLERTIGLRYATGTHLAFIDDDDTWTPIARSAIRTAMIETPSVPVLFRMRYLDGRELWTKPVLKVGNVSTQMILIPNDPSRLGRWTRRREGDYDFLASMRWSPTDIVWRSEVIAEIGGRQ